MANDKVLVVENDASVRTELRQFLESSGYGVVEATTSGEAKQLWREAHPDIALLDCSLPDGNALELVKGLRAIDDSIPVVILAAPGSIETAMEALKVGMEQVLLKPLDLTLVGLIVQRILEKQRSQRRHVVEDTREQRNALDPFVGTSPAIRRLAEMAKQVASSDGAVMIQGEPGTGKRMLARWIHQNGVRACQPFVEFTGGALTLDSLAASSGSSKAAQQSAGPLEIAHKGTVFLNEIRDLDWQVQGKLMKLIDKEQSVRGGDVLDREVNIQVISATRHDLQALVRQGQFRDDLYSRVSSFTLTIPPLRDRSEDIPHIVDRLLTTLAQDIGGGTREVSAEAMRALQTYSWPGNVRELRTILERALLLTANRVLTERDLHLDVRRDAALVPNTPDKTLDQVERQYIQAVLNQEGGRVEVAAKKLGIPRSSLYYKLKQYGLRRTGATLSQHT